MAGLEAFEAPDKARQTRRYGTCTVQSRRMNRRKNTQRRTVMARCLRAFAPLSGTTDDAGAETETRMTTAGVVDMTPSNGRGWPAPAVDRQPLQASSTRQRRPGACRLPAVRHPPTHRGRGR